MQANCLSITITKYSQIMYTDLVSIIIPYYNSESYLKRLIQSIKSQEYTNYECILVDDGSNDNSFELINDLIRNDSRFINEKRSNLHKPGGRGSKNFGFKISRGDLIVFFDSDDEMENIFLSSRITFLRLNSEFDAVISNYNYRYSHDSDKRNTLIYNSFIFTDFRHTVGTEDFWRHYLNYKFYYNPGNAMYRRKIIVNSGMWNENTSIGEDYEFQSRLILQGMNLGYINAVTFNYMLNDFSMIATSDAIKPLVSRSYGRMLVLSNLLNNFGVLKSYLITEFNWQLKILRRILFCNDTWENKLYAIYILELRIRQILELIEISKIKKLFIFRTLKLLISTVKRCSLGHRLFDFILFKEKTNCKYDKYMTFLKFDRI